ncbi:hypothetical protein [Novosphingobium sp. MMS21-SN21R]|nr:hypothetical protein [Novosphingobium sp. MMS21-SN21R]MDT0509367.1 hypothetical protein [Novosphingobium sp. MMS21-SN21R]
MALPATPAFIVLAARRAGVIEAIQTPLRKMRLNAPDGTSAAASQGL